MNKKTRIKQIIFVNHSKQIKKIINKVKGKVFFVALEYDTESYKIKDILRVLSDFQEINLNYPGFKDKFINLIAKINQENRSLYWWAFNFTNKNPITTNLCNKSFNLLVIAEMIKMKTNLLLISNDRILLKAIKNWARGRNIKVLDYIKTRFNLKELTKRILPIAIFFVYFRTLIFKFFAWSLAKNVKFDSRDNKINILFSLINRQSFDEKGIYRDAYFGGLPCYFKNRSLPFAIIGEVLFPPYISILKKAINNKEGFIIVSKEYFLSFVDLTKCFLQSLHIFLRPLKIKGPTAIDEVDLRYLIKKSIKEDCISTKFFSNLCFYYCIKNASKKLNIVKFYYPLENRSFEKMIILALRRFSPQTKIIGYQHASISPRHTNFFLAQKEYEFTPLPNYIITMGEETKEILRKQGRFPESMLKVGCALRQRTHNNILKQKKKKILNLFVALATNIEEYVKVLVFLDEAFKDNHYYNIWIRPHPVFSLEKALKIIGRLRFKFYKSEKESLDECFTWADAVLYVHSTLSLEALLRGIPVICIRVPDCLSADPLFAFNEFKWKIDKPDRLIDTILQIQNMAEEDFIKKQKKAKEYTQRYIYTAIDKNLDVFINV
jgi:hypothetical protein